jgi:tetratricopeptide (TPR) repeat protein
MDTESSKVEMPNWLRIVLIIFMALADIATLANFLPQIWRGDRHLLTIVVAIAGSMVYLGATAYVWLRKRPSRLDPAKRVPRFARVHRLAGVLFVIGCVCFLLVLSLAYESSLEKRGKLVVLVTSLDGPDSQRYRITEHLLLELVGSVSHHPDIFVQPLAETVTEPEGSLRARALGERYSADLVVWGWYAVTRTDVLVSVNVENLVLLRSLELPSRESYQLYAHIAEIESFRLQRFVSKGIEASVLALTGILFFQSGDYRKSIERISEVIADVSWAEPQKTLALLYLYRGTSHLYLRDYEDSIRDLSLAIQNDPALPQAYENRGISYHNLRDYAKALADYSRAISLDPGIPDYYYNRANIYDNIGKNSEALADYDKAIELNAYFTEAYNNRANVYLNQKDYEKAKAAFDKALMINPRHANAYVGRSSMYIQIGEFAKAIVDCNTAISIDSLSAVAFNNRGIAFYKLGENKKAIADYARAIRINPRFPNAYSNRGLALNSLGEYQAALQEFSKAIELDSTFSAAYYNRGITFSKLGNHNEAIANYEKALVFNEGYTEALNECAIEYAEIGQYKKALDYLNRLISTNPSYATGYANRGLLYYRVGMYLESLSDLENAVRLDSANVVFNFNRALTQLALGHHREALTDFETARRHTSSAESLKVMAEQFRLLENKTTKQRDSLAQFQNRQSIH